MTRTEQALHAENARLQVELGRAISEGALLRALVTQQSAQSVEQTRQITKLTAEVTRQGEQLARANERLHELLAILKRLKRPKRKDKGKDKEAAPEEPVLPPTVSTEAALAFEARPQPPAETPREETPKKKRSRNGPNPVPSHLPTDETVLTPDCCTCGCQELEIIDEVVEEKLDVVQQHQRRRLIRRKVARCPKCRKHVTAPPPPAPCERSKVTCGWLAWLVVTKFYLLVPLDRIQRDLALRGVHVSITFLVSAVERASNLLDPVDGEHWKQLKDGSWMQSDGTSLNVIVPGLPGTHKGYLEVYRRGETVVFQYEATKDGADVAGKLKSFKGVLLVDAESRFNAVFSNGDRLEAGCNAHGFRKFEDAVTTQPVLAAEGARFLSTVFQREAEAKQAGLAGDALRDWRQAKIRPIYHDLRRWMDAILPTLLPDDKLASTIRYYTNHWAALTRFIDHPEIPPDNSGSEREFQTVAKARLAWLFAGSTEGAHRAATLLGIVATARNLGIDIQAYLTWAFERLGTHRDHFGLSAAELTPAAYQATHPRPGAPSG